jgi:uncharacterized protein YfaS (alpha-2-macroglobulin family)
LYEHQRGYDFDINEKHDDSETILWTAGLKIEAGKYEGTFFMTDLPTTLTFNAEIYDIYGQFNQARKTLTIIPIIDWKMNFPTYLTAGDNITTIISVINNADFDLEANFNFETWSNLILYDYETTILPA